MGIKIKFADIDIETMNISVESVKKNLTKKQKQLYACIMAAFHVILMNYKV